MTQESHAVMIGNYLAREEAKYIEEMLEACSSGSLRIKTYTIVREDSFESMKEKIDALVEINPHFELAAQPLRSSFLTRDKWVAIMVEYEENKPS